MQFPLREASIMLWFVQRKRQARTLPATITQKPCNDKHTAARRITGLANNNMVANELIFHTLNEKP
jgi:hypothetical protein